MLSGGSVRSSGRYGSTDAEIIGTRSSCLSLIDATISRSVLQAPTSIRPSGPAPGKVWPPGRAGGGGGGGGPPAEPDRQETDPGGPARSDGVFLVAPGDHQAPGRPNLRPIRAAALRRSVPAGKTLGTGCRRR